MFMFQTPGMGYITFVKLNKPGAENECSDKNINPVRNYGSKYPT